MWSYSQWLAAGVPTHFIWLVTTNLYYSKRPAEIKTVCGEGYRAEPYMPMILAPGTPEQEEFEVQVSQEVHSETMLKKKNKKTERVG